MKHAPKKNTSVEEETEPTRRRGVPKKTRSLPTKTRRGHLTPSYSMGSTEVGRNRRRVTSYLAHHQTTQRKQEESLGDKKSVLQSLDRFLQEDEDGALTEKVARALEEECHRRNQVNKLLDKKSNGPLQKTFHASLDSFEF